jgi:hypothetical protein
MSYRRQVSIRLPEEIETTAKQAAAAERRSMANWIEIAIADTLVKGGYLESRAMPCEAA